MTKTDGRREGDMNEKKCQKMLSDGREPRRKVESLDLQRPEVCESVFLCERQVEVTNAEFLSMMIRCQLYEELQSWLESATNDDMMEFLWHCQQTEDTKVIHVFLQFFVENNCFRNVCIPWLPSLVSNIRRFAAKDRFLFKFLLTPELARMPMWPEFIEQTVREYRDISVLGGKMEDIESIQQCVSELGILEMESDALSAGSKMALQMLKWIAQPDSEYYDEYVAPYLGSESDGSQ